MKFIETKYFLRQLGSLSRRFVRIGLDYDEFKDDFNLNSGVHLGEGIYKFRIKNSSIPTGKSGGFRIILKIYSEKALPILIFSKTEKSNVSGKEILNSLDNIFKEL